MLFWLVASCLCNLLFAVYYLFVLKRKKCDKSTEISSALKKLSRGRENHRPHNRQPSAGNSTSQKKNSSNNRHNAGTRHRVVCGSSEGDGRGKPCGGAGSGRSRGAKKSKVNCSKKIKHCNKGSSVSQCAYDQLFEGDSTREIR